MATTAAQDSGLVNDVRTAAVVMLNLNVNDKRLVPEGIEWVKEQPRAEKPKYEAGKKLFKFTCVDTAGILADLEDAGFALMRLYAAERRRNFRVTAVLVRRDLVGEGTKPVSGASLFKLKRMLEENIWDTTAYRNPGQNGGNYSLELGNPMRGRTSADILCVCGDEALSVSR